MPVSPQRVAGLDLRWWGVTFAVVASCAFVLAEPSVGDVWAARARESAALDGVGLNYWFGWFGGTVPGHYSVLLPLVVQVLDPTLVGAVATVVAVLACHRLVRGSRHPVLATWLAAVAATANLWSGRVPFALGTALALLALLALSSRRTTPGLVLAVAATLVSPVSGAFLGLGLCGVVLHDRSRRVPALVTAGGAGVTLVILAVYFGAPGPQGFPLVAAVLCGAALGAMLLARPHPVVRTVVLVSLVLCPVVALVDNGLGSNFERLAWLCLPVATAATGRARRAVVVTATAFALCCALVGSAKDLYIAAQPMSDPTYTDGLVAHLDQLADTDAYRVEVVPDGAHLTAYTLLGHATLARGYETQSDHALNPVLYSPRLDAGSYRTWLDDNAVGYVALGSTSLDRGPEDALVRSRTPDYLTPIWSDADWTLFRVGAPQAIVDLPARVVDSTQAELTLSVPSAGQVPVRVRWSRLLEVRSDGFWPGLLVQDADGWTILYAPGPGDYVLRG